MASHTFNIVYIASIVGYFILQYQAWRHWSPMGSNIEPSFWLKANLMWTLGSKKQLTYGQIILHSVWGFLPITNTILISMQLGYMWISILEKVCTFLQSNTWWNTPVSIKQSKPE